MQRSADAVATESCGFLEWFPYDNDRTKGLNHQMASLSCALGEAHYLQRTLLLPDTICLFELHTQRWRQTSSSTDSHSDGSTCVPTDSLFDVERLAQLAPAALKSQASVPQQKTSVRVGSGWSSARVKQAYPCHVGDGATTPLLVRRRVDSEFWFQKCTRRQTDYTDGLATVLNQRVGAPPSAPKPMNILLRSGLFFSPSIKAAARDIRSLIGGVYASVHVRRSDKLTACSPEDCRKRDLLTRPEAIARSLSMWVPPGSHLYIGSTEPPVFFEPLRATYRLHFAEDFVPLLAHHNITNNYALYAVETLVFFGSHMSVESYSFQSAWFVDACFPAASLRTPRSQHTVRGRTKRPADLSRITYSPPAARGAGAAPAIEFQCRDHTGALINDVLYGPACVNNAPCGRSMTLVPEPRSCGQPRLSERLMLSNRSSRAVGARRCSAVSTDNMKYEHRRGRGGGAGGAGVERKGGAGLGGAQGLGGRSAKKHAVQEALQAQLVASEARVNALLAQLRAKDDEIAALSKLATAEAAGLRAEVDVLRARVAGNQ